MADSSLKADSENLVAGGGKIHYSYRETITPRRSPRPPAAVNAPPPVPPGKTPVLVNVFAYAIGGAALLALFAALGSVAGFGTVSLIALGVWLLRKL